MLDKVGMERVKDADLSAEVRGCALSCAGVEMLHIFHENESNTWGDVNASEEAVFVISARGIFLYMFRMMTCR